MGGVGKRRGRHLRGVGAFFGVWEFKRSVSRFSINLIEGKGARD